MTDPDANFGMIDFFSTLITLSIMLPIFYIVYLVWWKHDEPLVDGPLAGIVRKIEEIKFTERIRALDSGNWPRRNPLIKISLIVFIFCLASIPVAGLIGTDDPSLFVDRVIGGEADTVIAYDNGTITDSGTLNEGSDIEVPIEFSDNHIVSIEASLSWTDEPSSFFGGTNQPDTFTIQLLDPAGEVLDQATGDTGSLGITWSTSDPEAQTYIGIFIVKVILDNAGDDERRFPLPGAPDTSNSYSLTIEYQSYYYVIGDGDDADVRWEE
jgi:hypothetical protein